MGGSRQREETSVSAIIIAFLFQLSFQRHQRHLLGGLQTVRRCDHCLR